jgi:mono/diheme cytochrome c family protein
MNDHWQTRWRDLRGIMETASPRKWSALAASINFLLCGTALLLVVCSGCEVERRKSDAELGLNPQQAAGRRVYDQHCDRCHEPYSTRGKNGPGLKGVFKKDYLPLSGLPANNDRVGEIVMYGRSKMPGFNQALDQQQVQDLLAYMHTL